MNLWSLQYAGDEVHKEFIHPGLETQRHQKIKTAISVAPKKGLVSSKKIRKKIRSIAYDTFVPNVHFQDTIVYLTSASFPVQSIKRLRMNH